MKFNEIARVRFFLLRSNFETLVPRLSKTEEHDRNSETKKRPRAPAPQAEKSKPETARRDWRTSRRALRAKREIEVSGKEPGRSPVRVEENHEAGGKKDRRQRAKSDRSPSWCARSWRWNGIQRVPARAGGSGEFPKQDSALTREPKKTSRRKPILGSAAGKKLKRGRETQRRNSRAVAPKPNRGTEPSCETEGKIKVGAERWLWAKTKARGQDRNENLRSLELTVWTKASRAAATDGKRTAARGLERIGGK
jgi:hypothetical protein